VIGDAHCWYAGYPNRRDEPVVQKQERQAMLSPKRDKVVDPKPVQEPTRPYWLQSTNQSWLAEDRTQNWSVDRPQITQHQPPTIDTVDVVDADASALERQSRSLEIAFATLRRGMSVGDARVHDILIGPLYGPRGPPEARYPHLLLWLGLTIGLGVIILAVQDFCRHQSSRPAPSGVAGQPIRRDQGRSYFKPGERLLEYITARLFYRDVALANAPSPGTLPRRVAAGSDKRDLREKSSRIDTPVRQATLRTPGNIPLVSSGRRH